jgi:phage-related protein
LGYGGTKKEMERLIIDASKLDKSIDATDMSFGNIVKSINAVQKEMGIYGTTALEAEKTISGSIASTKAAWQNLITGVADDNADFEKLIDDFVKSVGKTANNILPRIQTALEGGGKLVEELVPVIIEQIPEIVENTLPKMLSSGVNIINKILEGISKDPDKVVNTVFKITTLLIKSIWEMLPKVLNAALQIGKSIVDGVWKGISNAASWFADKVKKFFSNIVDTVKKTLGIASPSKVFAEIGRFMAEGVGVGWNSAFRDIQRDINSSLDFDGGYIGSFGGGALSGADGYISRDINIVQNIYSQAKTAAELMREARWQAKMEVLTSV